MAKQNSTKWKIFVDSVVIDNLLDLSLEVNNKLIDVTSKDSAGWEESIYGLKSATFSGNCIADWQSSGTKVGDIFTKISAGTNCTIVCSDAVTSDLKYTFTGQFDKWSVSGGVEDKIQYSFSGKATGAVVQATI